jgi:hypothetical protein
MAVHQTVAPYIFIVDTDQYSGNFEREMCAFMTGAVGQCGVGEDEVEMYEANGQFMELSEKTQNEPDDNGCFRPASIWPTPNRWNDGDGNMFDGDPTGKFRAYESVAVFFCQRPTSEEIAFMKQRAHDFVPVQLKNQRRFDKEAAPLKIKGFRLIEQQVNTQETSV